MLKYIIIWIVIEKVVCMCGIVIWDVLRIYFRVVRYLRFIVMFED